MLLMVVAIIGLTGCGGAEERKAAYLEKAKLSLEKGDLDKARIDLKNVLQIDPMVADAYFQLGKINDLKKEYIKAFRSYSKAAELDPDNLEYQARFGTYLLLLAGDIDAAIEKRDLILGKDKDNLNGLLLKAAILLKLKNNVDAMKVSQEIFSKQPGHFDNAVFLSSLYQSEKDYDNSIKVLNASIKQNADSPLLKHMLASNYLIAGKNELAEQTYIAILENEPELFINHMKLAMFYREIGNIDKAEYILRKAIEADEEDSKRKLVLIEFIQQVKGNQNAINELNALISSNPDMGELRIVLGKLYTTENKLDDSERVFKSAVTDFSEDSIGIRSRVYLARLYMRKKNIDAAVSVIDDALKISPNDSEVSFVKAKLQLVNKDYEGAIISLRTVIKDDQQNINAYLLLSAAHKASGEEKQASEIVVRAYENNRTNASGLMALARYHALYKNTEKLEMIIDDYLSIDSNNYEALSFKSELLNKRKMFSDVRPYVLRLIELHPDMQNGYIYSIPYLLAENKKSEAITLLEDGYKKVKENTRILEFLVSLNVSLKNFDVAEDKVQSAIRENGETAELYMLLVKVQLTSNKTEAAKTNLLKSIDLKPDWNEPYLLLASIYTADKQNKKAIEILQQGLVQLKSDLKLTFGLAKIHVSLGDYNAAISEYEKAYEKYSDRILLINNLALLLSEHRDDESSLKRAKELADKLKNNDQAAILDTVGWVYYKTANYTEAANILKTVVEKSPDVALFNYHLGMALSKAGHEADAKTYLTRSLANNSNFPGKDDAEAQLKKLK